MASKTEATVHDLARIPDQGKAELINGEVVSLSPTGGLPNHAAFKIVLSLYLYAQQTGRGQALTDNAGFVVDLPHRKSFSPDAAFYLGALTMGFLQGAPVFAVEVRSEGDYGPAAERAMTQKRADYFAAGTLVVWDVDLLGDTVVRVYRAATPQQATGYRRGAVAEAEPALPGWQMPVDDLFA